MCLGYTIGGIRDDLLWSGQRHLFVTVWNHHEVHRQDTVDGAWLHRPFSAHMDTHRVEAAPQQPQAILYHFRAVGSWRRRLADSSQR